MSALPVSLEDKYRLASGRIYLNGTQALVRLAMVQRERDLAAGLNTAGFISGYRGSPLGGFDQALWKAKGYLKDHHIHFTPGVNEELAATAVWGSQQVGLFEGAKYDGVFAMWYGKGPGVDRCGDVFKHANAAGTARHGGVLLLAGDDHACKSSTLPHQSEHAFDAAMIPVLYPTGVAEIIDMGLHGFAMSRYSGCYVAFKVVSETVDSSASILLDPSQPQILLPEDPGLPAGGLNIRWPDAPMEQELRLQQHKVYAALAYARENKLNRITIDSAKPRLGIIASGKSYLDVLQALEDLGIDERHATQIGIRLYKVGMPWPLEPNGIREFAQGLEEILVVEEKRQVIEYQMKEQLYNWRDDVRPRVVGKYDEHGEWEVHRSEWLLPAAAPLLGVIGLAPLFTLVAARHPRPLARATLAALGWAWTVALTALLQRGLGVVSAEDPGAWTTSGPAAVDALLRPMSDPDALASGLIWVGAAILLGLLLDLAGSALLLVLGLVWSAGLVAALSAVGGPAAPSALLAPTLMAAIGWLAWDRAGRPELPLPRRGRNPLAAGRPQRRGGADAHRQAPAALRRPPGQHGHAVSLVSDERGRATRAASKHVQAALHGAGSRAASH